MIRATIWEKYQYLVLMTSQCNSGLKMPVFPNCTKFCILVKSFLNERGKKNHARSIILSENMETINLKFLLNSEVC